MASADLRDLCCHGETACEAWLASTETESFRPSPGKERRSHFASEAGPGGTRFSKIWISEADLASSFVPEVLESVVLHELGHACQRYWLDRAGARPGDAGYDEALGPETANCLRERLEKQRDQSVAEGRDVDFDAWEGEAFADAVFADARLSPWLWATSVRTLEDSDHPPYSVMLPCLASRPAVRAAFCSLKSLE